MIVHTVKLTGRKNRPSLGHLSGRLSGHLHIFVGCATCDSRYKDLLVFGRQRWEFYAGGTIDFTDSLVKADCAMIVVTENTGSDQQVLRLIDEILARNLPLVGVDMAQQPVADTPEKLVGRMTRYGWEWFAEFTNDVTKLKRQAASATLLAGNIGV